MRRPEDVTQFDAVDRAPDVAFLIRFLEAAKQVPGFRGVKDDMLAALHLRPGMHVMDAGCGFGTDAAEMADSVMPRGRVVGLDISRAMIDEARRRTGAGAGIEWHVADLLELPFADSEFDACRVEMVLMHIRQPERALSELARVTRPGGRIACLEMDLGSHMLDSPDRNTTRAILTSLEDTTVQGWIGRQLPRLFAKAGLTDVTVSPRAVLCGYAFWHLLLDRHLDWLQETGTLTHEQIERWWAPLAEAHSKGVFTGSAVAFLVSGVRAEADR
jgi:ubiquinone/menaquinone biosynthesis C-methylase UbiE